MALLGSGKISFETDSEPSEMEDSEDEQECTSSHESFGGPDFVGPGLLSPVQQVGDYSNRMAGEMEYIITLFLLLLRCALFFPGVEDSSKM